MESGFLFTILTGAAPGATDMDILSLLMKASGMVMGVLVLLVFFSLVSWYVIGYKFFYLHKAQAESDEFLENFWHSKKLEHIYEVAEGLKRSPISQVFKAGYIELTKIEKAKAGGRGDQAGWLGDMQSIERSLERTVQSELTHLESMVPFLATTGSAAPFVGLFGTVWGIMNSFRSIGEAGAANLATVAPGIAEALIATAIGLMAAIPAVIAFNYFVRRIKVLHSEMEAFSSDFLNIIKRHFIK